MKNILLVEDDLTTLKLVQFTLEKHDFFVFTAEDGNTALEYLNNNKIHCVILDLYLPDTNGFEIIKRIRAHSLYKNLPIIMLTSNDDKTDTVIALELGADDYITKPFNKKELIARLHVALRRNNKSLDKWDSKIILHDLEIDLDSRSVCKNNSLIDLTYGEFEILTTLASRPGKVFSRDNLLTKLWGESYIAESRVIDMHISSLRKKLGNDCKYIETVRGVGYRFKKIK
ncbi:response regulator transcription factor [Dethiothermospora halolimnae]|uniref:response regulator transcription factor n=1 Tax=Dethiothermospora halolimnae TaxID=3114390 RepID=UPI003CCC2CC9